MTTKQKNTVGAIETTLRIMETLKELDGAGVTELSTELDIPKSTVHSHLSTLQENEYVVRNENDYRLGLQFLEFGEYIRSRRHIYEVAKPEVEQLAEETGELANLLVEECGQGVYLCRARGTNAVQLDTYAGMRVNLHCTALGKAVMAHYPEERVDEILDRHGMPVRTETTITDREELKQELAEAREKGYAIDNGERLAGLRCIAAPITDQQSRALGAISISGPTSRMQGEKFDRKLPELLLSAANVIELNMTYS
ncbi:MULTISPECIES: IclR family transcriptional regulator [unclassified Haladaptatus]|uniref:IclR family transcriptional regulator n=1 Tax=unclassified Haladaptatus TaxID=2622732 RepID=UPI0023E8BB47|nr:MULTISPECIES: IclR family transcriptional regulator [unclassified Haladaptatus]